MGKQVVPPGLWAQQIEKRGCHYMNLNHVCKKTGKGCAEWCHGESCDEFKHRDEVVRFRVLDKNLKNLINEAAGNMLFVENDDTRFTEEDLNRMMDDVVLNHPQLYPYVVIDTSREGDALITIYQGIEKVLDREDEA